MNVPIFAVALALLLLVGLCFLVWNLLSKVEKYEEDILSKDEYIEKFKNMVDDSYTRLKQIDLNGSFEADDEVGHFFKSLKEIIFNLDAYYKNYVEEPEEVLQNKQ